MIQSDESERNAQRKWQVMGMDPSFELLADIEQLALERLTRLQQLNGYDAIFMYSIMTLLGRSNDGPQMVDAEFGLPIYALDDWADQNNVLVVMKCHLRKQTRDATNDTVRVGDLLAQAVRHGLSVISGRSVRRIQLMTAVTRT